MKKSIRISNFIFYKYPHKIYFLFFFKSLVSPLAIIMGILFWFATDLKMTVQTSGTSFEPRSVFFSQVHSCSQSFFGLSTLVAGIYCISWSDQSILTYPYLPILGLLLFLNKCMI